MTATARNGDRDFASRRHTPHADTSVSSQLMGELRPEWCFLQQATAAGGQKSLSRGGSRQLGGKEQSRLMGISSRERMTSLGVQASHLVRPPRLNLGSATIPFRVSNSAATGNTAPSTRHS